VVIVHYFVVLYPVEITSNHNSVILFFLQVGVLYPVEITSNHNSELIQAASFSVLYPVEITSNHNGGEVDTANIEFYILLKLHQTTTRADLLRKYI
jgi:hypothetical protein